LFDIRYSARLALIHFEGEELIANFRPDVPGPMKTRNFK
jgi:hypothetical protein